MTERAMIRRWLNVEQGDGPAALRGLLRHLLESGQVDAVLALCRPAAGEALVPALVDDVDALAGCEPLAPVMPANMAALVSRLSVTDTGRRLAAVLRPCEARALIELSKFRQTMLDRVLVIGVDCLGTYELPDYVQMKRQGQRPERIWERAGAGEPALVEGYALRAACQMCEHPVAELANLRIGLIGIGYPQRILLEADASVRLPAETEPADEEPAARRQTIEQLTARRLAARDAAFSAWRARMSDATALAEALSACVRCHNCMVACPICYCKECVFRTPTFDHAAEQYFRWAERKGALRLPADTLLFHLTRLNHMATSCVGCGMCDSACPNGVAVATMFRAVAHSVQALFDYEAGRSPDEEPPVASFRESELGEI